MSVWPGLGMNYGHQFPHSPYDANQVAADLAFLRSMGVAKLRIAFPIFDGGASTTTALQGLVQTALGMGFYVVWGVTSGSNVNAARWASFKSYVANTLVPWAQSLANPQLELSRGNEEEFHCDGTTLTVNTVVADMANLSTAGYTYGPSSYQTSVSFLSNWSSNGLGSLDKIGFNAYSLGPVSMAFNANNVVAAFGAKGYLSEWGTPNGYNDFKNEVQFMTILKRQTAALRATAISDAYYFCYRDGSFGLPSNAWAIKMTDDDMRLATPALFGVRPWFTGVPNNAVARGARANRAATGSRSATIARPIF